jgi:hypothetical protein
MEAEREQETHQIDRGMRSETSHFPRTNWQHLVDLFSSIG